MEDYARVAQSIAAGGKGKDFVARGDVGGKIVYAAGGDSVYECGVGVLGGEAGGEVVGFGVGFVDGKYLPHGVFGGGGEVDNVVFFVVVPRGVEGVFESAKHGGVEATMAVDDGVLAQGGHVVAVVGEDPAAGVFGFVESVSEIEVVVCGLEYGVVDVGGFDGDPGDGVGIFFDEFGEIYADEREVDEFPVVVGGARGRVHGGCLVVIGDFADFFGGEVRFEFFEAVVFGDKLHEGE